LIINKCDINKKYTKKIEDFAKKRQISIAAKIGYDRGFIDALANLTPIIIYSPKYQSTFNKIRDAIKCQIR
jgi:MinD superfamily P-loop ATPase